MGEGGGGDLSCSCFSTLCCCLGETSSISEDPECYHTALNENPFFETELRDGYRLVRMDEVLVSRNHLLCIYCESKGEELLTGVKRIREESNTWENR